MTLRETALRGGAHLVGREVGGLFVRFGGALLVTRLIGPANFGLYAGALAIVSVLSIVAQLGSEVYLIRQEEEPPRAMYDEVFTILLVSTGAVAALGIVGSLAASVVVQSTSALRTFQVLLLSLPLNVLWAPAQAKLERSFRFRPLAFLQVGSDATLYVVAVALAALGAGVWAPVSGTFASCAFLLVGSFAFAGLGPRIRISRERVRDLGKFGFGFVPAPVLWSSAYLINPLVVGPFLGSASVGYVALATRLADTASFVQRASYRVSLVALSRVQRDSARLRRGFEEILTIQAVGVGAPLALLALFARPLLPLVFGHEWKPALKVLPFVCFGGLTLGIFNAHLAFLYVFRHTRAASVVFFARFALLGLAALVLVPIFGLVGYGLAVLVSTAAWVLADRAVRRIADFRYGSAARWLLAVTPVLFVPLVKMPWGVALVAPVVALLLFDRSSRTELRGYAGFFRRHRGSTGEDAEVQASEA